MNRRLLITACLLGCGLVSAFAEDGYRLWLRYDRFESRADRDDYRRPLQSLVISTPTGAESAIITSARAEIARGLDTMLGRELTTVHLVSGATDLALGAEGYALNNVSVDGETAVRIHANSDAGALYGVFDLLRRMQMGEPVNELDVVLVLKIERRLLNHWDDLNGFVEGSTIGRVTDGSFYGHELSAIAGVANTGSDRNWTGHPRA